MLPVQSPAYEYGFKNMFINFSESSYVSSWLGFDSKMV